MAIYYEDVQVTDELLNQYEREKEKAAGPAKFGRFKAWLYYSNMRRRQIQGLHENSVVDISAQGIRTIHCVCGLCFRESELEDFEILSPTVKRKIKDLRLDEIQVVKGHRNLEDFKSKTVALIVDFLWVPSIGDYVWTAFCQECGKQTKKVVNSKAKAFVVSHNDSCGGDALG